MGNPEFSDFAAFMLAAHSEGQFGWKKKRKKKPKNILDPHFVPETSC